MKVVMNNGDMSVSTPAEGNSFNVGSDVPQNSSGIATARDRSSGASQIGGSISDDSIVTIGGMEMRVGDAVAAGAIVKNGDGTYSDNYAPSKHQSAHQSPSKPKNPLAINTPQTSQQEVIKEQVQQVPVSARLDGETEQLFQEFTASLPGAVSQHVMNTFADGQELPQSFVGQLASENHVEPYVMQEKIDAIREAFAVQAGQEIAKYGLDPTSVKEWAQENVPEVLKQAVFQQFNLRTTEGYHDVVNTYLANLDQIDPDAILDAELGEGITTQVGPDGVVLLNTPHGQFSWSGAVRAGLVNVSAVIRR
ncbi:MAG: hypothetical protein ABW088_00200 [Sedimenticola sp.]